MILQLKNSYIWPCNDFSFNFTIYRNLPVKHSSARARTHAHTRIWTAHDFLLIWIFITQKTKGYKLWGFSVFFLWVLKKRLFWNVTPCVWYKFVAIRETSFAHVAGVCFTHTHWRRKQHLSAMYRCVRSRLSDVKLQNTVFYTHCPENLKYHSWCFLFRSFNPLFSKSFKLLYLLDQNSFPYKRQKCVSSFVRASVR